MVHANDVRSILSSSYVCRTFLFAASNTDTPPGKAMNIYLPSALEAMALVVGFSYTHNKFHNLELVAK